MVEEIKDGLSSEGLGTLGVSSSNRGVVISLDNINFPADSLQLLPSEQEKLKSLGEVLKKYPSWDLLVEGFTAQVGSEESQRRLSEERAASVGDYLIELGVRQPNQIIYRGLGSKRPLAPNDTKENRQKN